MKIVIGGSPGTGSSLLRQMLNRHPDVYCGPELQLFVYPDLFSQWNEKKLHLVQHPLLVAPSVHTIRGSRLAGKEQHWSEQDVLSLIRSSDSLEDFTEHYFLKPMTFYGKSIWAEKTPENVMCFGEVLSTWPDAFLVHIVRNPLDTLASLMARGFPLFYAAARYLFNTAHGFKHEAKERYFQVRYEDLVTNPDATIEKLLKFLKFDPSADVIAQMNEPGNPHMDEAHRLPGWKSSELAVASPASVNRFNELPEFDQQRILYAARAMRISPEYAMKHELDITNVYDAIEALGYQVPEMDIAVRDDVSRSLKRELRNYRWKQIKARRLFYEKEKPVEIQSYLP